MFVVSCGFLASVDNCCQAVLLFTLCSDLSLASLFCSYSSQYDWLSGDFLGGRTEDHCAQSKQVGGF